MLRIGVCGLGTVGQSFLRHITEHQSKIRSNVSVNFEISMIADRSIKSKKYPKNIAVTNNILDMASSSDVDIIVELVGGIDASYELLKNAINNGKHIITANKALIAEHGDELFSLAKKNNIYLGFEASVAGAIPIIKTLSNSMANEEILSLAGIINGTCNYILDQMSSYNLDFNDALDEAKKLGYAEADPTFDINGMDAAHKISILTSLVYKVASPLKHIYIEGIENITPMDMIYAKELGYCIKHLGITKKDGEFIESRVHPVLVPIDNVFSKINGVKNSILINGDKFGTSMLYGNGAGGDATASAVISDLVDAINYVSNENKTSNYSIGSIGTSSLQIKNNSDISSPFYLRIHAEDISGVMAEITNILASEEISIEAVTQHEPNDANSLIPIVMITNAVKGSLIDDAIKQIELLEHVKDKVYKIRVFKIDEK